MSKITPIFVTAKTAAALFEMTPRDFLALVEEGVLPKPETIGNRHERWEIAALTEIVKGQRADSYEDIQW